MGICSCDMDDEYSWYHLGPSEFHPFNQDGKYKRRKRCAACSKLLNFGDACVSFPRYRHPNCDYELSRFGEGSEIWLATIFHCEDCACIYISLLELGYRCMSPDVPIREHLAEYWEITGFTPQKPSEGVR